MTLILTLATKYYILQVSDRLVSKDKREFDPQSNKNVIYHAKNGLVTIGYSGRAYLDDVPTDQWIAQKLRGQEWPEGPTPGRPLTSRFGRAAHWLDVGQSIELLRSECETAFARLAPALQLRQEFVIAGWQWQPRPRPILSEFCNSKEIAGRRAFHTTQQPRYWHWERPSPFKLSWIPEDNALSREDRYLAELHEQLRRTDGSPAATQRLLVGAIRHAARTSPDVTGQDCMSIFIPIPGRRLSAEANYLPLRRPRALARRGDKADMYPAAFSPWIVGPNSAHAPSQLVGSFSLQLGPVAVSVRCPEPPSGTPTLRAIRSQPRRPNPLKGQER